MLHPAQGQTKFQDLALHSPDPSVWHSDQGSIFPGFQVEERISEHSDWILAQSFEAALAVRVYLTGDNICKISPGVETQP